ncbi:MAG: four helix bundle protein [Candidatus Magasanikbacteria bacterium]|nr:four helix bundle protein [Candidatus Magasanikbacteria bacterium]
MLNSPVTPPPPASLALAKDDLSLMWDGVPILKKTIDLYKLYYGYAELFPKKDKYTIGSTCERYIVEILEILLQAGYLPKEEKLPFIKKASDKFDLLKVFIRLLRELNIIDQKKYLALQTIIQEIGRMFGGWMKSLNKPTG